jgi:hypothetical protein
MRTSKLKLIACYVATTIALSAAFWSNSVLLLGINDGRVVDCMKVAGAILLVTLIVALRRFEQGRSARWYLAFCATWMWVVCAMLVFGAVLPQFAFPTPQLLIGFPVACVGVRGVRSAFVVS